MPHSRGQISQQASLASRALARRSSSPDWYNAIYPGSELDSLLLIALVSPNSELPFAPVVRLLRVGNAGQAGYFDGGVNQSGVGLEQD